jgi:hypothetical protein
MKQNMITIPAIIGTAMLTAMIVGNTPAQQEQRADPIIATLSLKIDDLSARMDRMEHASGMIPQSASSTGGVDHDVPEDLSNAQGGRWMVVDNIMTSQFAPDYSNEINALLGQASSLQSTIEQEQENLRDMQIRAAANSNRNRGRGTSAQDRAFKIQQRTINRYQTQLVATNKQMKQLARAQNELTQIIHGHEGDTIITLQTKRDLTASLNPISTGDFVTWAGRRIDMNAGHESWEVTSIRLLDDTNTGINPP